VSGGRGRLHRLPGYVGDTRANRQQVAEVVVEPLDRAQRMVLTGRKLM
jgi:hypothetical protein